MIKTKKFYFLPFLDNLTAVGISLLVIFAFGNWFFKPIFATIGTLFMLFMLCGRIYVRMWNLSRKNTRYHYGLTKNDFIKFILPLVVFDLVLACLYCLCENGIIPLDKITISTYYVFPDNEARQLVKVSLFEYIASIIKLWFSYLVCILKNGYVMFLAPVLSFISAYLGYKFGSENRQITNMFSKASNKTNDNFNE